MNKPRLCFQALLVVAMVFMTGCYIKLLNPEPPAVTNDPLKACSLNGLKVSYYIYDLRTKYSPVGENVEKILLESFSACGIRDTIKSDRLEKDRISMIVYVLDYKYDKNFLSDLWGLVSFATLFIVPDHVSIIQPAEIYFILPHKESKQQLKAVQMDARFAHWTWLPLLFKTLSDEVLPDASYFVFPDRDAELRITRLGFRNIFDRALMDLGKDQQSAGAQNIKMSGAVAAH
jgi:hypothetical protein